MTHDPSTWKRIHDKYPAFTRKPSFNKILVQPARVAPRQTFRLPGSERLYYAHRNDQGKYAGLRRVGGRPKQGRNAPGYGERARARGKIIGPGLRAMPNGSIRGEIVS